MRIGAYEINEPVPELNNVQAISMIRPWVDAGAVGSMSLQRMEEFFHAEELGKLVRPGNFFDFTRYRPSVVIKDGVRQVISPNSPITYARRADGTDFLFLHLLEPHNLAEAYVDSTWKLLQFFNVRRYMTIGSMYDIVPHTRPLTVSGSAVGRLAQADLRRLGITPGGAYQGPTSIVISVGLKAALMRVQTMSLMVHLPQYTQLEEDCAGMLRIMEHLSTLYGVPTQQPDIDRAERQKGRVDRMVEQDPQLKEIVAQLETRYDARVEERQEEEQPPAPKLSPDTEKFLREMDKRFRDNK
jgi:hypothetical protein